MYDQKIRQHEKSYFLFSNNINIFLATIIKYTVCGKDSLNKRYGFNLHLKLKFTKKKEKIK